MRGKNTSSFDISRIRALRLRGFSISQISTKTGKSKSIVSKYIKGIKVSLKGQKKLLERRDWTKKQSADGWRLAHKFAGKHIRTLSKRDKLLILACLYWGEGTKRELNIINSDPAMLRVVIACLRSVGVVNDDLKVTLRLYNDISHGDAVDFWSKSLCLPVQCFKGINVLNGKKDGKLPYGMCRVRVSKGATYFKLIMALIERIKILSS